MHKKEIKIGDAKIVYTLLRRKRKTLALVVTPGRELVVHAPHSATVDTIENLIHKKMRWIESKMEFFKKFHYAHMLDKEYVTGESFLYLGRRYRLKVVRKDKERVFVYRGFIVVETKDMSQDVIKNLLDTWFLHRAHSVFAEELEKMVARFGITHVPNMKIRKMKTRWGSLSSKGNMSLNLLLIHAPKYAIEYVIAHELTHLQYRNHSKSFYAYLEKHIPDWKLRKEKLEKLIFSEF